jgi:N-glycosylase/DNA lyase
MDNESGEEDVQKQYMEQMRQVASVIDAVFNPDEEKKTTGFAVLTFPLGIADKDSRMNYMSNAERKDMIAAMKEFIARNEGNLKKNEQVQ